MVPCFAVGGHGPWGSGPRSITKHHEAIGSGELPQYALLPLRGRERFGDNVIMGSSGDRMGQMGPVWITCWKLQGENM